MSEQQETVTTKVKARRKKAPDHRQPKVGQTLLACNRDNLGFLLRNPWFWLVTVPAIAVSIGGTLGCHKPSEKAAVTGYNTIAGDTGTKVIFDTADARYEFDVPGDVKVSFTSAADYKAFQDSVKAERLEAQAEFMRQYSQLVETQLAKLEEESQKAKGAAEISAARFINSVHQQRQQHEGSQMLTSKKTK